MNPVIWELFGFEIRYFPLLFVISSLISIKLLQGSVQSSGILISRDELLTIFMITLTAGIIGARVLYILFHADYYASPKVNWKELVSIWKGGLAMSGGLFSGMLALYLLCLIKKIRFAHVSDSLVLPLVISQSLGCLGNFMNGEFFGKPTRMPWGVIFPYGPAAHRYPGFSVHPVMLYELLLNLAILPILYLLKRGNFRPGFLACSYLAFYSIIRFIISFFLVDDLYFGNFHAQHPISAVIFLMALTMIIVFELYEPAQV